MAHEIKEHLAAALANQVVPALAQVVALAMRAHILKRFPLARGGLPEAIANLHTYQGLGAPSGLSWEICFDLAGANVIHPLDDMYARDISTEMVKKSWVISLSVRYPLLTIESRRWCKRCSQEDERVDPELIDWAFELCEVFGLEYVDAQELRAWKISPETLTEEMLFRVDYTDDPNAFQLLFHE